VVSSGDGTCGGVWPAGAAYAALLVAIAEPAAAVGAEAADVAYSLVLPRYYCQNRM